MRRFPHQRRVPSPQIRSAGLGWAGPRSSASLPNASAPHSLGSLPSRLQERVFSQLFLCLSRACLGKKIGCSVKWRTKHVAMYRRQALRCQTALWARSCRAPPRRRSPSLSPGFAAYRRSRCGRARFRTARPCCSRPGTCRGEQKKNAGGQSCG